MEHLLSSRAGYGYPSDFSLPAVGLLSDLEPEERPGPSFPGPDEWLARLARLPLLGQPGEAWLYNTCYDILGVLIARVAGQRLPEFLAERLFEPLGMIDTGFEVPAGKLARFTSYHRANPSGELELVDGPDERWSSPPRFASGSGGLVSTVDDWHAFARLLIGEGTVDGHQLLSPESVQVMTTDHLTQAQREAGEVFLEGQGWGYGGSVDIQPLDPWNVPGRYGWIGGTGTAAYVVPATGLVTILLSQLALSGPTSPPVMQDFWRYAAQA